MIKQFTEPLKNSQKFLFTVLLMKAKISGEESIPGKVL